MTTAPGQKTGLEPLLLRTTYFSRPEESDAPLYVTLTTATAALTQTTELFIAADRLTRPDSSTVLRESWRFRHASAVEHPYAYSVEVVSIGMRSPLVIAVALPWFALKAGGFVGGVLLLAERICTFGPRVSRKRKEDLLRAAALDSVRNTIEKKQRADALALELIREGLGQQPDHMDFLDPTDPDDDDLEPVKAKS